MHRDIPFSLVWAIALIVMLSADGFLSAEAALYSSEFRRDVVTCAAVAATFVIIVAFAAGAFLLLEEEEDEEEDEDDASYGEVMPLPSPIQSKRRLEMPSPPRRSEACIKPQTNPDEISKASICHKKLMSRTMTRPSKISVCGKNLSRPKQISNRGRRQKLLPSPFEQKLRQMFLASVDADSKSKLMPRHGWIYVIDAF